MRYYLDKAGRPRNPLNHRSLRTADVEAAADAVRVLHPRDARLLHLDPAEPWTAESQARADLVRAGLEEPPPAPDPAPEPALAPPDAEPEPELLPAPEPASAPEPALPPPDDPTPPREPALEQAPDAPPDHAPEPALPPPDVELFEERDEPEQGPDADVPPDPECPCCASEVRTCARGHTYAPVSEGEARALLYMADGAVCAVKHRKTGEPQIPLLAMTSAEACAAMGMPQGSHEAAEAMVAAARVVMQKRGAVFAEYADVLGLLGTTMLVHQNRAAALAGREAAAEAGE